MKLKIHTQIGIAIVGGVVAGVLLGDNAVHIRFVGDIFIRLLKMIIVPLVVASMVTGVASIPNARSLGRIGLRTFLYYTATTLLAVSVGLVLVNILTPGLGVELPAEATFDSLAHKPPSAISILNDIVPTNILQSMAADKMLAVIFFSLLFGAALGSAGDRAKPLADLFEAFNTVMLKITDWIMRLAPFGVFALMASTIGQMGLEIIKPLALYMATVALGLAVHACVTLPALLLIFRAYSPLEFVRHMFSAIATAFSTASSAATLPITIDCIEKKAGIPNRIAGFVLPLGATINMDGTALYEAVAAVFIAQAYGIEMTLATQLIVMLTAALASIGAAAIPGAGLITLVIVLKAVNLPLEGIAMILAVDRILDMFRTAVNVWGDACGTAVIAKLEGQSTIANSKS